MALYPSNTKVMFSSRAVLSLLLLLVGCVSVNGFTVPATTSTTSGVLSSLQVQQHQQQPASPTVLFMSSRMLFPPEDNSLINNNNNNNNKNDNNDNSATRKPFMNQLMAFTLVLKFLGIMAIKLANDMVFMTPVVLSKKLGNQKDQNKYE
eukprot:CAMPEP_0202442632 /NCGR_PEP_ID=MMETSP1360-20130828/2028_1 /ASSEMBLY_ACC=CAM_ASM_000848 /TAXON_ID=515479 /ORGANISM="Licmophora paradoxa, Strain CCMP2313" /LENGTH=149 /DNA_ID=CAMNT_0049058051 /DNA_START=72 /DNA_END=521 /DNA_ORIENTATION=-